MTRPDISIPWIPLGFIAALAFGWAVGRYGMVENHEPCAAHIAARNV